MLSDIERKVLRIIINCSHYGYIELPPLSEFTIKLCQWTGREAFSIHEVLESLEKKGHVVVKNNCIVGVYEHAKYNNGTDYLSVP